MKQILNFINGEYQATGRSFDKRSPLHGEVIAQVHEAGRAEVEAAVAAARSALDGPWGRMAVAERVEKLYAVADGIHKRFEEFLAAECADTGKPRSLASHIDIPRGAANFKIFADVVKNVPTEFFEMATPDGRGAINYGYRSPVGVVGVICPWNLPLLLMTWKVGPALACGNTVVVKPSGRDTANRGPAGRGHERSGHSTRRLQRGARLRPRFGRRIRHQPPRRGCHHLHRRNPHGRSHHEGRCPRRAPGQSGNGGQKCRHRVRRCRL
jgi:hypothetical protein